jgi:cbb3-type cytochrome oxidase maturation protein
VEILFVLIPLSLGLVAFALWSFIWSVKNEQFEDLDRQGWSILFDEQKTKTDQQTDTEE